MTNVEDLAFIKRFYKVPNPTKLLYEPFDVKKHAANFICYCEVIVWPDGLVEYAVPSHNEALIKAYCKVKNMTREQVLEKFKNTYDCYDEMMKETGIIQVWYDYFIAPVGFKLTMKQHSKLAELLQYGCISDKVLENLL